MDYHNGRLLNFLDDKGLYDNALIIFMGDNGSWFSCTRYGSILENEWRMRNSGSFIGFKGRVWQNGINPPYS